MNTIMDKKKMFIMSKSDGQSLYRQYTDSQKPRDKTQRDNGVNVQCGRKYRQLKEKHKNAELRYNNLRKSPKGPSQQSSREIIWLIAFNVLKLGKLEGKPD